MDNREYLETLVSRLDIPLAKVEYRRVSPPAPAPAMMQADMFGGSQSAADVVKSQHKNNSVKAMSKRKSQVRKVDAHP